MAITATHVCACVCVLIVRISVKLVISFMVPDVPEEVEIQVSLNDHHDTMSVISA